MGIQNLNKYLIEKCSQKSIHKLHIENLFAKKIAVDISIYLYKFLSDGYFMEQVYLFLSLFKYYCIHPIFIFDGKPLDEKKATLKKRFAEKKEAQTEYLSLQEKLGKENDEEVLTKIQQKMNSLKKKMVRITYYNIDQVIELINAFGFDYYMAPHEADQLCVYLTTSKIADACMSDDMDMIVCGCPVVIRNLNLMSHECYIYHTNNILCELQLNICDFRKIIVLSGTDYEIDIIKQVIPVRKAFEYYNQYKNIEPLEQTDFHDWLHNKSIIQKDVLNRICKLFDISNYSEELSKFIEENSNEPKKMSVPTIKTIMKKYKFIFLGET